MLLGAPPCMASSRRLPGSQVETGPCVPIGYGICGPLGGQAPGSPGLHSAGSACRTARWQGSVGPRASPTVPLQVTRRLPPVHGLVAPYLWPHCRHHSAVRPAGSSAGPHCAEPPTIFGAVH